METFKEKIVYLFEQATTQSVFDEQNQIVFDDFIKFCQKKLDIKDMPEIRLIDRKEPNMSSAAYNPATNDIVILAGHRALVDILRSVAHELVHRQQDEQGRLDGAEGPGEDMRQDIGVDYENEANAVAGALVKEFSRFYEGLEKDKLYEL